MPLASAAADSASRTRTSRATAPGGGCGAAPSALSAMKRRQFGRPRPEPVRRLADPFQAALDGIPRPAVAGEGVPVETGHVALDAAGVLQDVGQAVGGVVAPSTTAGVERYACIHGVRA